MEREGESTSLSLSMSEGGGGGEDLSGVRQQLESRIETRHKDHMELLSSLQLLLPDLYPSLNLSLELLSTFHARPFSPLIPPPTNDNPDSVPRPLKKPHLSPPPPLPLSIRRAHDPLAPSANANSMSSIRSMLATCLLERIPFDPIDSSTLLLKLQHKSRFLDVASIESALRSMADDNAGVELAQDNLLSGNSGLMVMTIDRTRLMRDLPHGHTNSAVTSGMIWPAMYPAGSGARGFGMMPGHRPTELQTEEETIKDLEEILNKKSFKENLKSEAGKEIFDLLHRRTTKERLLVEKFKTKGGPQLQHYCLALTKEDCRQKSGSYIACEKVHFRRIIALHTDINLGDCSFLDTCRHMKVSLLYESCKYVHYELDPTPDVSPMMGTVALPKQIKPQRAEYCSEVELGESQWISCDIRNFRMDILGQFGVIMADPPWDIHMELPYGTMADDEMRTLNVPALQTDGLIFLWVTGRAMELGRECLELWGYKRVEEIIWVKTNQLQRIIRTGRTGHWLNHSKEHCLVGIKGNPLVNRNIDTDVIVAEVRETSRKPDEMYPLLERISPRTRKLELFARTHNTQSGWLSLGNQLNGVRLVDEGLRARFKAAYPDVEVKPTSPTRSSAVEMAPVVETSTAPPRVSNASEVKPSSSQDVEMVC